MAGRGGLCGGEPGAGLGCFALRNSAEWAVSVITPYGLLMVFIVFEREN